MKQKQKIILYITSIILITLVLIGFTYGYYMTNITGNTNAKSIEVQAGHSDATYTDLSEQDISTIVEPGYTYTKLFTVQNTGNLKATYSIYLMDVFNNFIRTEDITYTLYRNSGNNTIDISNLSSYAIIKTGTFPETNSLIIADELITNPNDYYTYALKIDYINLPGIDQSNDMDHTFSGNIQIYGASNYLNPYSEGTLAYDIVNNSLNNTSGTIYKEIPLTRPAQDISLETEKELSIIEDDGGMSYYYRGSVTDNYVNFSGMCWRIVRIEGDGSIKIILADKNNLCNSVNYSSTNTNSAFIDTGIYSYSTMTNSTSNLLMPDLLSTKPASSEDTSLNDVLNSWLETSIGSYSSKLKQEEWNVGNYVDYNVTERSDYYFEAYYQLTRDFNPSLKSSNNTTKYNNYIGILTAQELAFAGMTVSTSNIKTYLWDNANANYWTFSNYANLSSGNIVVLYLSGVNGNITSEDELNASNAQFNYSNINIRPSIVLKSNTLLVSGNGTLTSPYVVE